MHIDVLKRLSETLSGIYDPNITTTTTTIANNNIANNNILNDCSKIHNIYLKCIATNDVDICNKTYYSFLTVCDKHRVLSYLSKYI